MNSFIDNNDLKSAMTLNSLNSMHNSKPLDCGLPNLSSDENNSLVTATSFSLQMSAVPSLYSTPNSSNLSPCKTFLLPTLLPATDLPNLNSTFEEVTNTIVKTPPTINASQPTVCGLNELETASLLSSIPAILKRLNDVEEENKCLKQRVNNLETEYQSFKNDSVSKHDHLLAEITTLKEEQAVSHNELQADISSIKTAHEPNLSQLTNQFKTFRETCEESLKAGKQYSMRNSLIFKHLSNVPANCHGSAFSEYMAKEINSLLPHLTIPVSYHHIDTSHPLNNNNLQGPVVVKFLRRDQRNEIYDARHYVTDARVMISEHLIPSNQNLLNDARAATSFDDAWSNQGKIYMKCNGRTKRVVKKTDIPPVLADPQGSDATSPRARMNRLNRNNPTTPSLPSYKSSFKSRSFYRRNDNRTTRNSANGNGINQNNTFFNRCPTNQPVGWHANTNWPNLPSNNNSPSYYYSNNNNNNINPPMYQTRNAWSNNNFAFGNAPNNNNFYSMQYQ